MRKFITKNYFPYFLLADIALYSACAYVGYNYAKEILDFFIKLV
jgi:hypothetical protein